MRIKHTIVFVSWTLLCVSCTNSGKDSTEIWKEEILETESKFAKMTKDEGLHKAFLAFAAENVVLLRQDSLIHGKEALDNYFKNTSSKNVTIDLSWKPDFVDVANSGDMGYTYGKYRLAITDSNGKKTNRKGVFHTVWKRQAGGTWKFVWD